MMKKFHCFLLLAYQFIKDFHCFLVFQKYIQCKCQEDFYIYYTFIQQFFLLFNYIVAIDFFKIF